jgi:hypothetical protein
MLVPPELVRVADSVFGIPICTVPKFMLDGAEVNDPVVTAVAVSGMASMPFDASLLTDNDPLAAPPEVGVKVTLKEALWPAPSVAGRPGPLIVKPAPETLACDTVTFAVPVLTMVADAFSGWPTCTLPKLMLEGLDVNVPGPTATAVTGTLTTGFGASLVTATLPEALPADCGVNVTEKVFLCPGDKVIGKVRPLILKPRPLTVACFTVTAEVPELASVTD